jgi:tRNA nucleotidyltransferase (CCA-adding enzyme)
VHTHVEVTTFRGEGAYTDARRPDSVTFGVPLVEDLARRDLRVNAMAFDPATREFHDPFRGRADIAEKMLRAVGPTGNVYEDAVARFSEDGLRVMRAVRFAAVLEFALDPDTERGIVPALPSLAKVSKERVSDELRKSLATREPSRALGIAQRVGILGVIAPALADGFAAWPVTEWLALVDGVAAEARLAAFASPLATKVFAARSDRASGSRTEALLKGLKFSNEEAALAAALVAAFPAALSESWTETAVRRLLADLTRPRIPAALSLWSVSGARTLPALAQNIATRGDALALNELAITGKDLMSELGLPPGRALGQTLAMLLDRVLDDPALNTADSLLALAKP